MLPESTQTTVTKGIWFVHNDGINTIKIFGSPTGKEKIYLNEELVSEQVNINLKSSHSFEDQKGNNYSVEFLTTKLMKGQMTCNISLNGEHIKSFRTNVKAPKLFQWKRFLIIVIISLIFGILKSILELSDVFFYIYLGAVVIVNFLTREPIKILIEED